MMASQAMESIGYRQHDRVRKHTAPAVNAKIDRKMEESVIYYATQPREKLSQRIEALEREWDIERVLEISASTLAFSGFMLGLTRNKSWFLVPGIVLPALFMHALQGWCPPVSLLRRMGIRTRREIDAEKYTLKGLRGDFDALIEGEPQFCESEISMTAVAFGEI
ncbi:MAG TPA: hypothetical protein V6C52_00980 [Coleofasciculaceae cyanobacterium]|jgi:hypothetical protein